MRDRRRPLAPALLVLLAALPGSAATAARWRCLGGDPAHTGAVPGGPVAKPELAWTLPLRGPLQPPVADGDQVLLADAYQLHSIALQSGEVLWKTTLPNPATSAPAVASDRVLLGVFPEFLLALGRKDGKELWRVEARLTLAGSPVIGKTLVFAEATAEESPTLESKLAAYRLADGVEKWRARYPLGQGSSPALAAGTIFIARRGSVDAFDAATGQKRFSLPHRGPLASGVVAGASTGWITATNGTTSEVKAFDLKTGKPAWKQDLDFDTAVSMPALAGGKLLVAVSGRGLVALDPVTGKELWTAPSEGQSEAQPVAGSKLAYWLNGRSLAAASLADGAPAWTIDVGGLGRRLILAGDTLLVSVGRPEKGAGGELRAYR